MPDGHVKWFDEKAGEGVVEHNGREYAVAESEIDNHAKVAGAPVHFDIDRSDGGDLASNVTMRAGTRTTHRTGRYGDLTGAHHAVDKGRDERQDLNELTKRRRAYPDQPRLLAEDWVALLGGSQVDRAVELYAPDAVWHEGDQDVAGRHDIHLKLQASPLLGAETSGVEIAGDGADRFLVSWPTIPGEEVAVLTTLRVGHGAIVEQWTEEGRI